LINKNLSYRKQIVHQLRIQYVKGIYVCSNSMTMNSRLEVTKGIGNSPIRWIIYDFLLVELFDLEYYGDLEMWVRGHSRSLKMVPIKKIKNQCKIFNFGDLCSCVDGLWLTTTRTQVSAATAVIFFNVFNKQRTILCQETC